jgi:hypothetical protein
MQPTRLPTSDPTMSPTGSPTMSPTKQPTREPTREPTEEPTPATVAHDSIAKTSVLTKGRAVTPVLCNWVLVATVVATLMAVSMTPLAT